MIHTLLITAHTLAATLAFVAGCLVLRPPASARSVRFSVYAIALGVLVAAMLVVVAFDWVDLQVGQRITFALLSALGVYTGWRGFQAWRELRRRGEGWRQRYVGHLGFTLISLFDAFTIVASVDFGAPVLVVIAVGVAGVVVGSLVIGRAKSRLA